MDKQTQKHVISEEIAIQEMEILLNKFSRKKIELSEIKESYPNSVEAICKGLLVINDFVPVYKLANPITSESGEVQISDLTFKTRVKPTVKADLADGLDLKKSAAKFSLRLMAHVVGLASINYLDKFEREDYDLIEELTPVFM